MKQRLQSTIKPMVLAIALALPAASSIAASMSEVVTTREDQDIHQQYGRDSVYAIQTRQPAPTESRYDSHASGGVGAFFSGVGSAGAAAWHKVTGLFEPGSSAVKTAEQSQPQLHGRAGGYVGADQLALLEGAQPASGVSEAVTTTGALGTVSDKLDQSSGDATDGSSVIAQSAPSPDVVTVRDQELNEMTEQPADAGAWKQPDEANAEEK